MHHRLYALCSYTLWIELLMEGISLIFGSENLLKLRTFRGLNRVCPQYCWKFHGRLWEALSGTTSEKRGVPSRTGGEENSGNALEASDALNYRVWRIPAVLSTGIPGNALRAFPGSFRNFFRKVPAVLGVRPIKGSESPFLKFKGPFMRLKVGAWKTTSTVLKGRNFTNI